MIIGSFDFANLLERSPTQQVFGSDPMSPANQVFGQPAGFGNPIIDTISGLPQTTIADLDGSPAIDFAAIGNGGNNVMSDVGSALTLDFLKNI